jgi:hypothetical protein
MKIFNEEELINNGFTPEEIEKIEKLCSLENTEIILFNGVEHKRCTKCGLFQPLIKYGDVKYKKIDGTYSIRYKSACNKCICEYNLNIAKNKSNKYKGNTESR